MLHFSSKMTRTSPKEKFQLYKAIHFTLFPFLKAIFAAMDPDPILIESGFNPVPDPQQWSKTT